jgi:hypothetical protein
MIASENYGSSRKDVCSVIVARNGEFDPEANTMVSYQERRLLWLGSSSGGFIEVDTVDSF